MKAFKLIIILSITLLVSQSCRKGSMWGIYGKGSDVTRTHTLTGFSSLRLTCDANVSYVQDSVYSVQVSGQENILSVMELKVVDSQLKIDFLRDVRSHNEVRIVIHSPNMSSFYVAGSGNITCKGALKTDNMGLYINGSGDITIPTLNCSSIDSKITGSGNITLSAGTAKTSSYNISGSGNIYATGLECESSAINISGSGNISVNVSTYLDVNISGSGDVRYKGKPTVKSEINGSGSLIKI